MANLSNINGKFVVNTAGNIGVGTLTPRNDANTTNISIQSSGTARLFVNNTGASGKEYAIYSSANGDFGIFDYNAVSARLVINSAGNATFAGEVTLSAETQYLNFKKASTADVLASIISETDAGTGGKIRILTKRNGDTAINALTIDDNQNVGIGTTTPNDFDGESRNLVIRGGVNGSTPTIGMTISTDGNQASTGRCAIRFADGISGTERYRGALEYNHNGDDMSFRTAGTQKMTLTDGGDLLITTGNVGIGTTSPTSTLSVQGTTNNGINVIGVGTTANRCYVGLNASNHGQLFCTGSSGQSPSLISSAGADSYISGGNVGIGTASPNYKLTVADSTANGRAIQAVQSATSGTNWGFQGGAFGSGATKNIGLQVTAEGASTNYAALFTGGNVGIGITSPNVTLHVDAGQTSAGNLTNNVAAYIGGAFVSNDLYHREGGLLVISGTNATQTSAGIAFQTRNTGNTNYWKSSILMNRNGELEFYTGGAGTGQGSKRMVITSGGDVLISKTSLSFTSQGIELRENGQINVAGTVDEFNFYNTSAAAYRFFVTAAGSVHATSTSIVAISDITLKENIKPLETGLNEVMKLKPRRFDWKNGDGKNIAGFIAQEVEEVLPDLVSDYKYTDEETKKALKMGDMIPTLVKSIQELKADNDSLRARIETLENN